MNAHLPSVLHVYSWPPFLMLTIGGLITLFVALFTNRELLRSTDHSKEHKASVFLPIILLFGVAVFSAFSSDRSKHRSDVDAGQAKLDRDRLQSKLDATHQTLVEVSQKLDPMEREIRERDCIGQARGKQMKKDIDDARSFIAGINSGPRGELFPAPKKAPPPPLLNTREQVSTEIAEQAFYFRSRYQGDASSMSGWTGHPPGNGPRTAEEEVRDAATRVAAFNNIEVPSGNKSFAKIRPQLEKDRAAVAKLWGWSASELSNDHKAFDTAVAAYLNPEPASETLIPDKAISRRYGPMNTYLRDLSARLKQGATGGHTSTR